MDLFIKVIKKLYWLGLIGLLGTFFKIRILELFYLFFLLGIVDVIISFIIALKEDDNTVSDLKLLFQNLGMLIGIPVIYLRNFFILPNVKNYQPQILYQLPFQGCYYVVNGGIDKEHSHSWNILNQRYAYDFYLVKEGKTHHGDGNDVSDYYCYGKAVLAPARGVVVEMKNCFNDTLIKKGDVNCNASDVRGNYLVIKHSKNEYSMIAHLKKNSFLVRVGDRVEKGEPVACVGNSGNTSEPHIHFQVQQGKSFFFSAGIPIYFDSLNYLQCGQYVENKKVKDID